MWHEWDDARCDAEEREALAGSSYLEYVARLEAALTAIEEQRRKEWDA